MNRLLQFLKKFYYIPSSTLNTAAKANISKINDLMHELPNPILLNLGCGERFIGGKNLDRIVYKKIINLDLFYFPSVDIIANANALPFKENSISGIVCQAVLEHTKDPKNVVEGMYRILRKKGIIYVEVPFLQGYHPTPRDYYRFTLEGVSQIFSKFSKIDSGVCAGPSSAFNWICREYVSGLLSGFSENKFAQMIAVFISGWLTFSLKYLDYIFSKKPSAQKIASAFYFMGRKN